jgi:hypothetical protein
VLIVAVCLLILDGLATTWVFVRRCRRGRLWRASTSGPVVPSEEGRRADRLNEDLARRHALLHLQRLTHPADDVAPTADAPRTVRRTVASSGYEIRRAAELLAATPELVGDVGDVVTEDQHTQLYVCSLSVGQTMLPLSDSKRAIPSVYTICADVVTRARWGDPHEPGRAATVLQRIPRLVEPLSLPGQQRVKGRPADCHGLVAAGAAVLDVVELTGDCDRLAGGRTRRGGVVVRGASPDRDGRGDGEEAAAEQRGT